ncbi:vascular endothelial growth factor receptor 2 [Trichonephila clavipes]|nr:vascular endothelial growth factor receptor 2 [Trichonephila clavipes]
MGSNLYTGGTKFPKNGGASPPRTAFVHVPNFDQNRNFFQSRPLHRRSIHAEFKPLHRLNEVSKMAEPKSITSTSITLKINLENIYLNNTGNYKCFAIPRDGDTAKEKSAIIRVLEIQEPVFLNTNWDTELTAAPNSVLEFNCSVEGTPRPKIIWYRNGEILTSNLTGGKFEDNFQMLVISRLVEDDSGDYACVAENIAGIIMRNMTLNVISSGAPVSASQNASESVQIWILIAVGVSTISVLILLLLLGKWFYRRKYTMMKLQGFNHQLFQEGQFAMFDPNMPLEDQADLLPYDSRWEFGKENLKFVRGRGNQEVMITRSRPVCHEFVL